MSSSHHFPLIAANDDVPLRLKPTCPAAPVPAGGSNGVSPGLFQWTAWTRRAPAEVYACRGSATALWGGAGRGARAPGPPAWTSALDTELSWQIPEPAAVILTGRASTVPQVSCTPAEQLGLID